MGIRTDNENIKDVELLQDKAQDAVFFTERGTKVPDFLDGIVWELRCKKGEALTFDPTILVTDHDLSMIQSKEDAGYKISSAEGCAELKCKPVVLDVESEEAVIYVFPVPEGDMMILRVVGRRDGKECAILDEMRLFRRRRFRLTITFDTALYFQKEVRIATGKE